MRVIKRSSQCGVDKMYFKTTSITISHNGSLISLTITEYGQLVSLDTTRKLGIFGDFRSNQKLMTIFSHSLYF